MVSRVCGTYPVQKQLDQVQGNSRTSISRSSNNKISLISCQGWSIEFPGTYPDKGLLDQVQGNDQGPPYQGHQIAKCPQ